MARPDFTAHRTWQVSAEDAARAVDIYLEQVPAVSDCGAYWFDRETAIAAVQFFPSHCRLTKGEWMGRPFSLAGWQALEFVIPLFGWKRFEDGYRRYRTARMWVPRKNGKTELAAGLSHLLLLGDEEGGAEGYALAANKDQADIVFAQSQTMIPFSPELSRVLDPLATATWCESLRGSFKPLSGKPDGKHGFNPSYSIGDELHEWKNGDLLTFVTQGMGTRRQPLDIGISTAGTAKTFGHQEYERNLKIRDGLFEDPETLVLIYAADPKADWTDPETWATANPGMGVNLKPAYFHTECRKAQQSPRLENAFKNFHLNLWTQQAVRWLSAAKWAECRDPNPAHTWRTMWERMRGRACYVGGDLSAVSDITALSFVFPPAGGDPLWRIVPRLFVPEDTVPERVKNAKVPYDLWVQAGALETTPGSVIDQDVIAETIREARDVFDIVKIGFDKWNAMKLGTEMLKEGAPLVWYPQTMAGMSGPAKELEKFHLTKAMDHGGHPVLSWMADNVAVLKDTKNNIFPSKQHSAEKIDGIVATVMGIGLAIADLPEAPPETYVTSRPMLILN